MTEVRALEIIHAMWLVFGTFVGACLGSFANVVMGRVPEGLSVVHPPSRCPKCNTPIAPWDNIPIVSWLVLRGKARCCGVPISPRYVIVETLGAIMGFMVVLVEGPGVPAIVHAIFLLLLVCVAGIDLDTWTIPRGLTFALLVTALLGNLAMEWDLTGNLELTLLTTAKRMVLGALVGFGVLFVTRNVATWAARRAKRIGPDEDAMGSGDEELLGAVGAMTGAGPLFPILMLASIQGTVIGILARMLAARTGVAATSSPDAEDGWVPPDGAIPFGPFIALGATEWVLAREHLPTLDLTPLLSLLSP